MHGINLHSGTNVTSVFLACVIAAAFQLASMPCAVVTSSSSPLVSTEFVLDCSDWVIGRRSFEMNTTMYVGLGDNASAAIAFYNLSPYYISIDVNFTVVKGEQLANSIQKEESTIRMIPKGSSGGEYPKSRGMKLQSFKAKGTMVLAVSYNGTYQSEFMEEFFSSNGPAYLLTIVVDEQPDELDVARTVAVAAFALLFGVLVYSLHMRRLREQKLRSH